jgi:hypothetical protein
VALSFRLWLHPQEFECELLGHNPLNNSMLERVFSFHRHISVRGLSVVEVLFTAKKQRANFD